MKVEKNREKVTYIKETTLYKAEDGLVFTDEWACKQHERFCLERDFKAKAKYIPDLEGFAPFDGEEYPECHDYQWFFVDSLETAEKLNELYPSSACGEIGEDQIGQWVCIESDDCISDFWWETLDRSIGYAKKVLDKLGFEMIVKKKGE